MAEMGVFVIFALFAFYRLIIGESLLCCHARHRARHDADDQPCNQAFESFIIDFQFRWRKVELACLIAHPHGDFIAGVSIIEQRLVSARGGFTVIEQPHYRVKRGLRYWTLAKTGG